MFSTGRYLVKLSEYVPALRSFGRTTIFGFFLRRIKTWLIASARLYLPRQSSIKELYEIVFAVTIFSTIMALLATLDIWIWVPLH
jgi:hypothetical protein